MLAQHAVTSAAYANSDGSRKKMTDYTPTTEQVRDAYVRGMRDTFIASAGEHREEFERWVQAHHAEVRASVQPPTREQIAEAKKREMADDYDDATTRERAIASSWFTAGADAVLALFPQTTPSAEPTVRVPVSLIERAAAELEVDSRIRSAGDLRAFLAQPEAIATPREQADRHIREQEHRTRPLPPAQSPSIADMTPGPTLAVGYAFTALAAWSEEDDEPDRWRKLWNGRYSLLGAAPDMDWDADCINWSTIRDLTPPLATPEEGDRG